MATVQRLTEARRSGRRAWTRGAPWGDGGGSHDSRLETRARRAASVALLLAGLPGLLVLGQCLMGQKLKTCSLVTWATTRAMALVALVLGPPMSTGVQLRIVKRKKGMARLSLDSPARGICMISRVLFKFELFVQTMRRHEPNILIERYPKPRLLMEGCTEFTNICESESFVATRRIYGIHCGLDVKFAVLINAVQATISVEIIHAPACGLNLKLYAKTSGFSDVIRLFRGVAESGYKMSSVVAVTLSSYLDLCIEGSPEDGQYQKISWKRWKCRFGSCYHGTADEMVKLDDSTTISVKVSWKAVDRRPFEH